VKIRVLGEQTELGGVVSEEARRRGHEVMTTDAEVVINVGRQPENSLLSDGWAWRGAGRRFPTQVAELIEAGATARLVVDASCALLYGTAQDVDEAGSVAAPAGNHRFAAAVEAERALRDSGLSVCTLRLGYGYGPEYQDLRRYRTALHILRPYYAGPGLPAPWIHHDDAASALVTAAEGAAPGDLYNVADEDPVSLRAFIDHFGRSELHWITYHLPRWSLKFLGGQIRREQETLLDQSLSINSTRFRDRFAWRPKYPSYREGLAQTVLAWKKPV